MSYPGAEGHCEGFAQRAAVNKQFRRIEAYAISVNGNFRSDGFPAVKNCPGCSLGHHYGIYALYTDADTWLHRAGDLAEGSPELEGYVGILKATALMNRRQPYKAMQILDDFIRTHLPAAKQFECAALSAKAGLLSLTGSPDEANETYLKAIETSEARNNEYELLTAYHAMPIFVTVTKNIKLLLTTCRKHTHWQPSWRLPKFNARRWYG